MPEVTGRGHEYTRGSLETSIGIFTQLHLFRRVASGSFGAVASAQQGKHIYNEFICIVRGYKNIKTMWKIVSK